MNIIEYKEKNPKIFWGTIVFIVIAIALGVGLGIGLQAPEAPQLKDKEKTLDEKAAEIINKPSTTVENFDNGPIICSNPRNENYQKAILLFIDIFEKKENNEMLSYSTRNFIVKDGDKTIMDLKEEQEKKNFAMSEFSKVRKLMETLDKRFGKKANYVHLFFVIKDYLVSLIGNPKDNLDEKQKLKFIDIFAPVYLFAIIYFPFQYYITNEVDWSEDIFTYENNKLAFNPAKIQNEYYKRSEIKRFADNGVGKSISEITAMNLKRQEESLEQNNNNNYNIFTMTLNKIDYENEDFINTFNSSNDCIKSSDKEYYNKKFKYSDIFKGNAVPSTPAASSPSTPAASSPSTPAASSPSTPAASSPSTPAAPSPSIPAAPSPSIPAASSPSTPAASSPSTPTK
jgi:hypothetical protein